MSFTKSNLLKYASILSIVIGAALLIYEISVTQKNYYLQSIGLVFLMIGVFLVNAKVPSKNTKELNDSSIDQE